MTATSSDMLHATCVAIKGRGVLIEGASGSGKSDLALRLIDRGAVLVSDDYTQLRRAGSDLLAAPPANLAGRLEVRGVGIVSVHHVADVPVSLLVSADRAPMRLPYGESRQLAGIVVRCVAIAALEPSAPLKVELALRQMDVP